MLLGAEVLGTNVIHIPHVFMKHAKMQFRSALGVAVCRAL